MTHALKFKEKYYVLYEQQILKYGGYGKRYLCVLNNGKVERVVDFGAFILLPKGGEGLLHISKISKERVNNVSDILSVGQEIEVKVLKVKKDRIELSSN